MRYWADEVSVYSCLTKPTHQIHVPGTYTCMYNETVRMEHAKMLQMHPYHFLFLRLSSND